MSNRLSYLDQNSARTLRNRSQNCLHQHCHRQLQFSRAFTSCLRSIEAEPREQVVVVDNTSTDGSAEMVKRDFPGSN